MGDFELNIIHYGERFASIEDAQAFSAVRDYGLCVPQFIRVSEGNGFKIITNPAWIDAPYEEVIVEQQYLTNDPDTSAV